MSKKYGNDNVWCYLEEDWSSSKSVDIWHSIGTGQEEVMAHATDRYNAKKIVDAFITSNNVKKNGKQGLDKKEVVFLEFVSSNCAEPWSTMANNALLWQDKEAYNRIKTKFSEIY